MPEATPRTLPTAPIPQVAYDQIIEEGWGDSVAQSLNNVSESVTWLTSADEEGVGLGGIVAAPSSATFTTWLTPTQELFVPDWAGISLFHTHIYGIADGTGGPNSYDLQLSVGGVTSGFFLRLTAPVAEDLWFTAVWVCLVDVTALSGSQEVQILARRVDGTGVWTTTDASALAVMPRYQGAVNWYGD